MPSRIAVIINASAGTGTPAEALDGLAGQFRSDGLDAQVTFARNPAEFKAAVDRALNEAPHAVVAGGGDGTISTVAARLVGTGISLGVLPLGTLNHFARDMHIPADIAGAVRCIAAGNVVNVDVGELNGSFFLNNASLGIYPAIVRDRDQQRRLGAGKWTAFMRASIAVLRRYPFLDVRLTVNGEECQRRTPFVFVGNNEYCMEGVNLGGRGCLDAGKLNVYVTRQMGRLGLLRLAAMALLGRLREARDLEVFSAGEILVETRRRRVRVAMDGEVARMDAPLRFRIRPGALRVIVPAPAAPGHS